MTLKDRNPIHLRFNLSSSAPSYQVQHWEMPRVPQNVTCSYYEIAYTENNTKLSYRRETARQLQLPTWRGEQGPPAHSPSSPPLPPATPMPIVESETRNKRTSNVPSTKRTLTWIGHSRSFKVILIGTGKNPEPCVVVMPTLFLKLTKIWQRENGKFVDFNDLTQVWRRPSKKRLWISTNDLYCQKLRLLTYIFVPDSMGLQSLIFK